MNLRRSTLVIVLSPKHHAQTRLVCTNVWWTKWCSEVIVVTNILMWIMDLKIEKVVVRYCNYFGSMWLRQKVTSWDVKHSFYVCFGNLIEVHAYSSLSTHVSPSFCTYSLLHKSSQGYWKTSGNLSPSQAWKSRKMSIAIHAWLVYSCWFFLSFQDKSYQDSFPSRQGFRWAVAKLHTQYGACFPSGHSPKRSNERCVECVS